MKNKRKNKINILKNISILKKDLLNPKIFSNNYKPNTNINNKSGSISSKLSYKIEILILKMNIMPKKFLKNYIGKN